MYIFWAEVFLSNFQVGGHSFRSKTTTFAKCLTSGYPKQEKYFNKLPNNDNLLNDEPRGLSTVNIEINYKNRKVWVMPKYKE